MDIATLLSKIPFFNTLTPRERDRLSGFNEMFVRFGKDEAIIEENTMGTAFFVLVHGSVRVVKESQPDTVLATLKPGSVFGEMAFLSKTERTTSVRANDDAVVIKLTEYTLNKMSAEVREKIKDKLILILIDRINSANKTILDLQVKGKDE
jgi:CRP-like cAMP-binding protein